MDTKEKTVSHLNYLNIRCREPPIHFQEIREVIITLLIWAYNARAFFNLKNKFYES